MSTDNHIKEVYLQNFGLIKDFYCDSFAGVNVILGENSTGKTFLLKALYSSLKSVEEKNTGAENRSYAEILAQKLYWTFQVDKIGDIVTKSSDGPLNCDIKFDTDAEVRYQFSQKAERKIQNCEAINIPSDITTIFIPAREVLSIFDAITESREYRKEFGFDDTYYDLVKILRIQPQRGKNFKTFSDMKQLLKEVVNGKVEYDSKRQKWIYKRGNQKYSIGATSDGIKKISVLDHLLSNHYLGKGSILFIDEVESGLHPSALVQLIDILRELSLQMGIQVFISTHSYFVIKKLVLDATTGNKISSTCISLHTDGTYEVSDLSDGMPDNSIIDESIRLYEAQVDGIMGD